MAPTTKAIQGSLKASPAMGEETTLGPLWGGHCCKNSPVYTAGTANTEVYAGRVGNVAKWSPAPAQGQKKSSTSQGHLTGMWVLSSRPCDFSEDGNPDFYAKAANL